MEEREASDAVNDFGRDPIGEGKDERVGFSFDLTMFDADVSFQAYNKKLKSLLDNEDDDAPRTADMGENKPAQLQGKRGRVKLEDLTRYTMVKRIW